MKNFEEMTVGEIVADNFGHAAIFNKYNIDFCCNGYIPLSEACKAAAIDMKMVVRELREDRPQHTEPIDFKSWPTELLIDYILKFHHRNIRTQGPEIATLLDKVCRAHADNHPELYEVQELFLQSLPDLDSHLQKEELILFPYLYELCKAQESGIPAPPFHCSSVESPIAVMMAEHDAEGERFRKISHLSNGFTPPADACSSYRLLFEKLKNFEKALHHHIHLENNMVFLRAIGMEAANRAITCNS